MINNHSDANTADWAVPQVCQWQPEEAKVQISQPTAGYLLVFCIFIGINASVRFAEHDLFAGDGDLQLASTNTIIQLADTAPVASVAGLPVSTGNSGVQPQATSCRKRRQKVDSEIALPTGRRLEATEGSDSEELEQSPSLQAEALPTTTNRRSSLAGDTSVAVL